jgi:hypothetical protein
MTRLLYTIHDYTNIKKLLRSVFRYKLSTITSSTSSSSYTYSDGGSESKGCEDPGEQLGEINEPIVERGRYHMTQAKPSKAFS